MSDFNINHLYDYYQACDPHDRAVNILFCFVITCLTKDSVSLLWFIKIMIRLQYDQVGEKIKKNI